MWVNDRRVLHTVPRILVILVVILSMTATAQGFVALNSSEDIRFNVSSTMIGQFNSTGLSLQDNNVYDFFGSNCGSNEVVARIKADGTYACTSLDDAGTDDQNLSEVLVQGNVANQSIDMSGSNITGVDNLQFDSNITIGDESTSVDGLRSIAVGLGASANDRDSVVIGHKVSTSGPENIVIGNGASTDGSQGLTVVGYGASGDKESVVIGDVSDGKNWATVVGRDADADRNGVSIGAGASSTAGTAIAIGAGSSASASKAVAIGRNANAPNSQEATLGNLGSGKLDLNVTGNVTVHGIGNVSIENGDLDLNSGTLHNIGGIADCSASEYLAGDGTCQTDSDSGKQTLNEVLVQGNVANTSINMSGSNLIDVEELQVNGKIDSPGLTIDATGGGNPYLQPDSNRNLQLRENGGSLAVEIHGAETRFKNNPVVFTSTVGKVQFDGNNLTRIDAIHGEKAGDTSNLSIKTYNSTVGNPTPVDRLTITGNESQAEIDVENADMDMNENNVTGINSLQAAQGGDGITVTNSTGQNVARFQEDGDLKVPNGNLNMSENNVTDTTSVETKSVDLGNGLTVSKQGDTLVLSD